MEKELKVKDKILDCLYYLDWATISLDYFGMGHSFLYKKIKEKDTKGNPIEPFTAEEIQKLKEALKDISKKIDECADRL